MSANSSKNRIPLRFGKPIQLFRKRKDGYGNDALEVVPEALRIIENIKGPIAVMSVVGPMRQGKSYLLSRILGRQKAFELGSSTNPKTFGIWTWDTPYTVDIDGQKVTLILLDTEGLEALCATGEWDTKIFLISLLLSSLFIYNTCGVINRSAIQKLRIMIDLNELIQSGSNTTSQFNHEQSNSMSFSEYFPQFLWVIRDFTLQYPEGITTAKEYMLQALTTELNTTTPKKFTNRMRRDLEEADEIRSTIVSSFSNIDCHTMPLPISNPESIGFKDIPSAMQALDSIQYDNLAPQFLQSMEEFYSKAFGMLSAKRHKDGSLMNGISFAQLLLIYTEQINTNNCVKISDAYQVVVDTVTNKILDSAVSLYRTRMRQKLEQYQRGPISDELLTDIHGKCYDEALTTLNNNILGTKQHVEEAHERFKNTIVTEDANTLVTKGCVFGEFYWNNSEMVTRQNQYLIKRFWTKLIGSRINGVAGTEFTTHQQYIEAVEDFKTQYYRNAIPGRQASEVFFNYAQKIENNEYYLNTWLKQKGIFEETLARIQQENLKAQQEASRAHAENLKLYESMKRMEDEQQSSIQRLQERLEEREQEANQLRREQKAQMKSQRKALQKIKNQELAEAKSQHEKQLDRQDEERYHQYIQDKQDLTIQQCTLDANKAKRKSLGKKIIQGTIKMLTTGIRWCSNFFS